MSEQLRIILIIIVSVSIFGLIVFVMVKNYIRNKIQYYLEEKNKKCCGESNRYFFRSWRSFNKTKK